MAGERLSVHAMVQQCLQESKEKLATADTSETVKTASAQNSPSPDSSNARKAGGYNIIELSKLADACDFVSENIHTVSDERTPQEKLAEYAAVHEHLSKMAEGGDVNPSQAHQTQKSNPDSDPPATVSLNDSGTGVGAGNAIPSEETNTPGTSMDAHESGSATPGHQTPKVTTPNEKANPQDAANAFETNSEMMMPEQPEDVLKQAQAEGGVATLNMLVRKGLLTKEAAEEAMVDPSWSDAQQGMARAGRSRQTGYGQFMPDPDQIANQMGGAALGGAGGAVAGGGLGAGIGALLRKKLGPGATGAGAALGALTGGTAGVMGGSIAGNNRFMRSKGINPSLGGLGGAKFTPEAAERYGVKDAKEMEYKGAAANMLLNKAASAGVSPELALAIIRQHSDPGVVKLAEDALNPAKISGGTEPLLQSEPGVPSAQMQGSEVGSNTPRETAPTSGEGGGRELLSSIESVINATKRQAKSQNAGALAQLLTEPSMSSAHDKTLQQSLDNASSAGVKISSAQANAARELLRKLAASPEGQQKVAALAKLALDPDMAPGGGAPPGEEPPIAEEEAAEAAPEVSDEALEAAKSGVTPEEIAEAEQILAEQGEAAAQEAEALDAEAAGGAAPEAGDKEGMTGAMAPPPPAAAGMADGGGQMAASAGGTSPTMTQ